MARRRPSRRLSGQCRGGARTAARYGGLSGETFGRTGTRSGVVSVTSLIGGDPARDGTLEPAGDDGAEGSACRKSTYDVEISVESKR
jgi:hypothetical protein